MTTLDKTYWSGPKEQMEGFQRASTGKNKKVKENSPC